MDPNYLKDKVTGITDAETLKYALLTDNEVVMMLPEFRTVLADLRIKWQTINLFNNCELQ